MKKKGKRVVGAVLGALMLIGALGGCGGEKKPEAVQSPPGAPKPPLTIRMVNRVNVEYVVENNPMLKAIEEKANVKLEIEIPPISDYSNRLNVIMASGDLPDLIHLQGLDAKYQTYGEDGLLIPLDDYLKNCPNITARIQPGQLEQGRVNKTGKIHSITRPMELPARIALYRKDWLDALNLKAPQTIEEFENVARAVSKGDPDKNGKDDTYFMSLLPGGEMEMLLTGTFGIRGELNPDANGKVTITEGQEGYIKLLDFYRKLYAEKLIDPEWYLNKTYGDRDKFNQGKLAMITNSNKPDALASNASKDVLKAFPQAKVDYFLPIKNSEGKRMAYLSPTIWGAYAISNTAKEPERIMKFIDWCYSDEGIETYIGGVKGITYESYDIKTGICKFTPAMVEARTKYFSTYMTFLLADKGKGIMIAGSTDEERNKVSGASEAFLKETTIVDTTPGSFAPGRTEAGAKLTDINNTKLQYVAKYILGQISKEEFVKFIQEKYLPANKEVIAALQQYYDTKLKK